jgi:hypothetical protein
MNDKVLLNVSFLTFIAVIIQAEKFRKRRGEKDLDRGLKV